MDREQIVKLAALLGEPIERVEAALEALGEDEHFYYNPNVFSKLHKVDCEGLRKLVVPDLSRLRR